MNRILLRLAAVSIVFAFLAASPATAHPSHADSTSMRADVRIDEARGLRVRVYVEMPTARVEAAREAVMPTGDDEAFRRHMWERLGAQLGVTVDGSSPAGSWEPADDPRNGHGTRDGYLYVLEWVPRAPEALVDEAVRDDGRLVVRVDLDALPDDTPYLSASARAKPPWRVVSDSAAKRLAKERWSRDPALRDLEVVFETGDARRPSTPPVD